MAEYKRVLYHYVIVTGYNALFLKKKSHAYFVLFFPFSFLYIYTPFNENGFMIFFSPFLQGTKT